MVMGNDLIQTIMLFHYMIACSHWLYKFVSLWTTMKFYDKYPQLKEKKFLTEVLIKTEFSTMSLENQQVSMPKVEEIVLSLLKEQELKGRKVFFS